MRENCFPVVFIWNILQVLGNEQNYYYRLTTKHIRAYIQNPDEHDRVIDTIKFNLQRKRSVWKCTRNLLQKP